MKTIEEKAKAYDKAIERVNSIWYYKDKPCIVDIVEIFPELKESEDEKMRRKTLKVLNYYKDEEKSEGRMPTEIEECIAWLEKQGEKGANGNDREIPNSEQRPAEWSEEDTANLLAVKCIIDEVWRRQSVREMIDRSGEELETLWHWLDNIWQRVAYPQTAWKPSDEQMAALSDINVTGYISYVGQGQELINLYQDLKKLMEE